MSASRKKGDNLMVSMGAKVDALLDSIESRCREPKPGDMVTDLLGWEQPAILLGIYFTNDVRFSIDRRENLNRRIRVNFWKALRNGKVIIIRDDHMRVIQQSK